MSERIVFTVNIVRSGDEFFVDALMDGERTRRVGPIPTPVEAQMVAEEQLSLMTEVAARLIKELAG
jgi:hypothetical protein